MANLDTNQWYSIVCLNFTDQAMVGTGLYTANGTSGAVFMQRINTSIGEQRWQIFPFNYSYYIFRTSNSGPEGYLNIPLGEATAPGIIPNTRKYTLDDASALWQITSWGDNSSYLTNAANGPSWHLGVKSDLLMALSSDIKPPQNAQEFVFNKIGPINDVRFSTFNTPGSMVSTSTSTSSTPTATNTPSIAFVGPSSMTSASASATTTVMSSKANLSSGAIAGIGADVGGIAILVAIGIAGLFFYARRRKTSKQNSSVIETQEQIPEMKDVKVSVLPMSEMMVPPTELQGQHFSHELPI